MPRRKGSLAPTSEPIDKNPVDNVVWAKKGEYRAMSVRACDGPYRDHWFRFYFGFDEQGLTLNISDGRVVVYDLVRDDDPHKWGLHYDPIRSENLTDERTHRESSR